jgi:phosphoribosyl 1,2-cyclic phosphodiesterase
VRVASLGSGSRGNATLLSAGGSSVLVDCGFGLREVQRRAAALDFDLAQIDAILVTHEHSDHCSGVAALARRLQIPVYLTHGTLASGRVENCPELRLFDGGARLQIGALTVQSVTVPHDAREPVQYCVEHEARRVGILTDLGSVTPHVCRAFGQCDLLMLEFNHDRRMLAEGPYPPSLKRRVGGDWGHLSNTQAIELLAQVNLERLRNLVIAHTSEKNNSRASIEALLESSFPGLRERTVWAEQDQGFAWINLDRSPGALSSQAVLGAEPLASATANKAY